MNHYYISAARGSDSTGDGSATNPWKTIGKAIGTPAAISLGPDGARVFVEPGTYFESIQLGPTPTASAPLEVVGDCDGAAFLAGGLATPRTGVVDWSGWASDFAPASTCLNASNKGYVSLRNFKLHGGDSSVSCLYLVGTCPSWAVRDVTFAPYPGRFAIMATPPAGVATPLTLDGCDFYCANANAMQINTARAAAEYSLGYEIRNCRFRDGGLLFATGGTGEGMATGVLIEHCSFLSGGMALSVFNGSNRALAAPFQVRGCVFLTGLGLVAGHPTNIAEDWNDFCCTTPRTNMAAGPNSRSPVRPAIDREDGRLVGIPLRPTGTPTPGSPLGGRVGSGSFPARDFAGRARPEGLGSALPATGALERHDTGGPDAVYADAGSPACLKLTGPASLERPILVDAVATTIAVKVRWDGGHGDANKPRAFLLANPEIGVAADQVLTATTAGGVGATPNAFETLTFAPVTPTRAGALMLRLQSRSATGQGAAYFDSIVVS